MADGNRVAIIAQQTGVPRPIVERVLNAEAALALELELRTNL